MRRLVLVVAVMGCRVAARDEAPALAPAPVPAPMAVAVDAAVPVVPDVTPVTDRHRVAVGMGPACARTAAGKLACWSGVYGASPVVVAGIDHVAGVATGQQTVAAWTTTGEAYAIDGGAAVRVPGILDVAEIAVDPDRWTVCARRNAGTVVCWRDLGAVDQIVELPGITGALEIAVAGDSVCARTAADVLCNGTDPAKPVRIAAAAGATRLAGGHFRFVALRAGAAPVMWSDQLDHVTTLGALGPDVQQVALGGGNACARGAAGVKCWSEGKPAALTEIAGLEHATDLGVGFGAACAVVGAEVQCWGQAGNLGDGTEINTEVPVDVWQLTDATQLTGGDNTERTCARRATGASVCWGGGLSDNRVDPAPVPARAGERVELAGCKIGDSKCDRTWSGMHQRGSWTCTRRRHKTKCTETYFGRHQDTETGPAVGLGDLDSVRDLRMPSNENGDLCVADEDGSVRCFDAMSGAASGSTVIAGITDVVQLAVYGEQTCALERAGKVWCWRANEAPHAVATLSDVVEIVGGNVTACARHATGAVGCWGYTPLLGNNRQRLVTPGPVPGVAL